MSELETTVHRSIEEVNRNQWNNIVVHSETGSVFHRHEWLLAVERGLDHEPYHVVVRKNGNPVGLFPNFLTELDLPSLSAVGEQLSIDSIPESVWSAADDLSWEDSPSIKRLVSITPGYGGPVLTTSEEAGMELVLDAVDDIDDTVLNHTIKAKETAFVRYNKLLSKRGYEPVLLDCRFEVPLSADIEEIVDEMDKERRKALRDARERDHDVDVVDLDAETIPETYRRYLIDIDRVDGEPHPEAFFEAIAAELGDRATVFVATVDGEEVGRYVCLLDEECSTLHYFFSAIGDSDNFAANPAELLHVHAMEWAKERGYDYYDFGSTGSDFRDGTFRFKEKFSGRLIPTLQWERGSSRLLWPAYKLARNSYQRMVY